MPGSNFETHRLWVRDGNPGFGVTVQVKGANPPTKARLRSAAVNPRQDIDTELRG